MVKTRILVLSGDQWHSSDIVRRGLAPLADGGLDFVFLENGANWTASGIGEYPLVVLAKSNVGSAADKSPWLPADSALEVKNHIQGGHGLLILHSGTAGYQELPVMRALTGGCFLQHPPECLVDMIPQTVHPVAAGANPFTVKDEHYFVSLDDREAEVFLQSRSMHGIQPAGWTRPEGRGRVCVLTPGHNAEVWLQPMFQTLLGNALRWSLNGEGMAQRHEVHYEAGANAVSGK